MNGRDAIIYVPGLGTDTKAKAVDGIARRIASALDRNAADGAASFSHEEGREEDYKGAHKTRIITITRRDGAVETPVADVYELNYADALTGSFRKQLPIVQGASVARMVVLHAGSFVRSVRAKSKTFAQQAQVGWAGLLLVLLTLYMLLIMGTAVATAVDLAGAQAPGGGAWDVLRRLRAEYASWADLAFFQYGVVFLAFVGFLSPIDLKAILERVAGEITPVMKYLSVGERRGVVVGQLADLLEHITEKEAALGIHYDRIHLVGYSFGSVVALDGVFQGIEPSPRFARIRTLVTIGSPVDFIRSYWPRYFEGRMASRQTLHWHNYFDSADVLATEFAAAQARPGGRGVGLATGSHRLPDEEVRVGPPIDARNYTFLSWLTLIGFRVHGQYWDPEDTTDPGALELVVRQLYRGHPVLTGPDAVAPDPLAPATAS